MGNSLMPLAVRILLSCVLVAVAAVHLRHLAVARGDHRGWHVTHALMALAMLDMCLPTAAMPVPMGALQLAFLVLAVVVLTVAVARLPTRRAGAATVRNGSPVLWFVTGIGLLGMVLMTALPASPSFTWRSAGLAAAAWFTVDAVAWALGALSPQLHHLGRPERVSLDGTVSLVAVPVRRDATTLRVSLAAMGLATAYLMVAMSFGAMALPAAADPGGSPVHQQPGGHVTMGGMGH